ncbi:MAG: AtpZ/AtpI family protein [bacterium]|jgi:F0F1-type ATP synthase assembly protein I|nr:AtpZ/AtpI family protein [Bacillota bacterium]HHW54678.1 AtpZ/AtpI family protein [Bacillota bacterium]
MKADRRLRLLYLASSFTFVMAGSIAAGYFLGQYLDRQVGGDGLLTALFILLGILAGFYNLYRVGKRE